MAQNYWLSSHHNEWIVANRKQLDTFHPHDREWFTASEIKRLRLYFVDYICKLGYSPILSMRQRIVASAIVYFKRFYMSQSFIEFDPYLVAPTMLFVASKAEEVPLHSDTVIKAAQSINPIYEYQRKDLLECEFFCLELLRFDLIVHHSYRALTKYLECIELVEPCFQTAWSIANDSYLTDVALVYPPHVIAVACIYMAATFHDLDIKDWMNKLRMSNKISVFDVIAEILDSYDYRSTSQAPSSQASLQHALNKLRSHTIEFSDNRVQATEPTTNPAATSGNPSATPRSTPASVQPQSALSATPDDVAWSIADNGSQMLT